MAIMHGELRSLLKDVALNGVTVIQKRKLLFLLGWGQDRGGAWGALLDEWVEIAEDRAKLHGGEIWGERIVLTADINAKFEPVSNWT